MDVEELPEGLPYALYLNGRLIARAADVRALPLGDIAAYMAEGPDDVFSTVDTRTGKTVDKTNGALDLWDREADELYTFEELIGGKRERKE